MTVPFSGGQGDIRVKGLGYGANTDRVRFPIMDAHDDPYYQHLTEKKDELIHSETWDADEQEGEDEQEDHLSPEEAQYREKVATTIRLYEPWNPDNCHSYEDVGAVVEQSGTWVGNRVREWERGQYRDLVADPREG